MNILRCHCTHCSGPMEFPLELQGEKIVCPHCQKLTVLNDPNFAADSAPPAAVLSSTPRPVYGSVKKKSEIVGVGCLVQAIGVLVIWVFPIGTIIGIALLVIGSRMAVKKVCSNCGNPLSSDDVKICPSCHALLLTAATNH